MITLADLAALADSYPDALREPVAPLLLGDRVIDTDRTPVVMGCINLSRDSTYRDSVAPSTEAAVRRGRVLSAQGADIVDLGAESSTAAATRVDAARQLEQLLPVVGELSADGIAVSVETYRAEVAEACLDAGATVINCTGSEEQDDILALAASHKATVVLCYVPGVDVREIADAPRAERAIPDLLEHFRTRLARARDLGAEQVVIDPGLGFYYGNLTDPKVRVQHQTEVLLQSFRLRQLGLPVCHALPHAFDLFGDQFRSAEPMFAVLARIGGAGVFRTHEVPQVRATLDALATLSVS